MEEEKFDAIIVGAGPAGSAAAYRLAKAGKAVLLIERGDYAGSKNVSGGRIYSYALEEIEKGFCEKAELERCVTHEQIMMLDGKRSVNIEYSNPSFSKGVPQSYTVLRAKFDSWFSEQVEAQGAMYAPGIKVDDLIIKDGKVTGIVAMGEEMFADIVIAADGVNSLLAQKAGLLPDLTPHHVGVGVKEIIKLPAEIIEKRFHLKPDEGAARMIMGGSNGAKGGTFLYTNRDTISLGCVFTPESISEEKESIHEIFQQIKLHPAVHALIEDGETIEYGAHLVPESGFKGIPQRLYTDGLVVVGDAAGFVINQGYTIRGMDLAILSGLAAADAILNADKSSTIGELYLKGLESNSLLKTMKTFKKFPELMDNERLFTTYPKLAADIFDNLFTIDGEAPSSIMKLIKGVIRDNTKLSTLTKDGWQIYKSIK